MWLFTNNPSRSLHFCRWWKTSPSRKSVFSVLHFFSHPHTMKPHFRRSHLPHNLFMWTQHKSIYNLFWTKLQTLLLKSFTNKTTNPYIFFCGTTQPTLIHSCGTKLRTLLGYFLCKLQTLVQLFVNQNCKPFIVQFFLHCKLYSDTNYQISPRKRIKL